MSDRVIFKFPVRVGVIEELPLPVDARCVLVAVQRGQVCVWYEVRPNEPTGFRRVLTVGTGHPFPENTRHIGSCITPDGAFVWHCYEVAR